MARIHGKAGKTLQQQLFMLLGFVVVFSLLAWFLIQLFVPTLAPLGPIIALVVGLRLLNNREISRLLVAKTRGLIGESSVGKHLENLPAGWRVFHDLDLGGENADHVVVSPGGVFNIEVKNYSGRVIATPKGLYNKGRKQDKIVRQAWRQTRKLNALLGVEVQPVLVFTTSQLEGDRVGKLPVMTAKDLVPYLLSQNAPILGFDEAKRLFGILEAQVK